MLSFPERCFAMADEVQIGVVSLVLFVERKWSEI